MVLLIVGLETWQGAGMRERALTGAPAIEIILCIEDYLTPSVTLVDHFPETQYIPYSTELRQLVRDDVHPFSPKLHWLCDFDQKPPDGLLIWTRMCNADTMLRLLTESFRIQSCCLSLYWSII